MRHEDKLGRRQIGDKNTERQTTKKITQTRHTKDHKEMEKKGGSGQGPSQRDWAHIARATAQQHTKGAGRKKKGKPAVSGGAETRIYNRACKRWAKKQETAQKPKEKDGGKGQRDETNSQARKQQKRSNAPTTETQTEIRNPDAPT